MSSSTQSVKQSAVHWRNEKLAALIAETDYAMFFTRTERLVETDFGSVKGKTRFRIISAYQDFTTHVVMWEHRFKTLMEQKRTELRAIMIHADDSTIEATAFSYVAPQLEDEFQDLVRNYRSLMDSVNAEGGDIFAVFGAVKTKKRYVTITSSNGLTFHFHEDSLKQPKICSVPSHERCLGREDAVTDFLKFAWRTTAVEELSKGGPRRIFKMLVDDLASGRYKQLINQTLMPGSWEPVSSNQARCKFEYMRGSDELWTCHAEYVIPIEEGELMKSVDGESRSKAYAKEAACKKLFSWLEDYFPEATDNGFPLFTDGRDADE